MKTAEPMIGQTVSHYKIQEKIGEGGMGVVYRAEDLKLKRQAALKFLTPKTVASEESKNRLVLEARAAAALDHPNICTVYEIGEHEGQTFIAMALISGGRLKDRMASGPLALSEGLDIAVQVAQGLEEAHGQGIIHRDIKPANIMITDRGQVKIMDFGLAKFGGDADVTQTIGISGTVAAMSPEQAQGEPVDFRTDIWSFGILFFEILTGKHPFQREHPQAMVYAILREDPEPMSHLRSGIPPELESIVFKCLQKDSTARYAAMGELLKDLQAVRSGRTVSQLTVSPVATANVVAVMDFANITKDPECDWLAGGIAETVTVDLKKIAVLNVLSREKVLRAMGRKSASTITERDIIDIGQSLKARWIVWGGFQKMGAAIRITAHFTEVSTGKMAGSAKVDGRMEDIFGLQDRIIISLMETMNLDLPGHEFEKISKPETIEIQAYEYYARGRQVMNQMGMAGLREARELYEKAIRKDRNYALAYSGLGCLGMMRFISQTDPKDLEEGIARLKEAIKLDAGLADPYLWLAYGYTRRHDFEEAVEHGTRAIELEPDNFLAHYFLGTALMIDAATSCRPALFGEALRSLNSCTTLQPHYIPARMNLAWVYMLHGQYPSAYLELEKASFLEESGLQEGPRFVGALTLLGNLHYRRRQYDQALEAYGRALQSLSKHEHVYRKPFCALTHWGYGSVFFRQRRYDKSLEHFRIAEDIVRTNPKSLGIGYFLILTRLGMAKTFYRHGMRKDAQARFQTARELLDRKKEYDFNWVWEGSDGQSHYEIASYSALVRERQGALGSLRKAVECGWADWPFLEEDDCFALLRGDQEFEDIVEGLKTASARPGTLFLK